MTARLPSVWTLRSVWVTALIWVLPALLLPTMSRYRLSGLACCFVPPMPTSITCLWLEALIHVSAQSRVPNGLTYLVSA